MTDKIGKALLDDEIALTLFPDGSVLITAFVSEGVTDEVGLSLKQWKTLKKFILENI